jgi:acetolactate synthase-1/2/3 large subunit
MAADAAWDEGGVIAEPLPIVKPKPASAKAIEDAARAIKGAKRAVLVVGGDGLVEPGVSAAGRIEAAGVKAYHDMFVARLDRGAGLCALERLAYFSEMAREQLAGADLMVVVGQNAPVSFFAYPNRPRSPIPDGCAVIELGDQRIDVAATLAMLADALGAPAEGTLRVAQPLDLPEGPLNAFGIGAALSRRMPKGAVVADDGITSGMPIFAATAGAARHSWLGGTGGAIGSGMPNAIGAAVGAPDAKVVCVTGDGSAMYTCQSLWTMAREKLNITTIVCNNRAYRILDVEMLRTGANQGGPAARALFDLDNPRIDFVKLAESQGVRGARCDTAEALDAELARCFAEPGPHLIEAVI